MAVVHFDLSPEQEVALRDRAQVRGLSVEEHIVQLLREDLAEMDRVPWTAQHAWLLADEEQPE